MIEYGIGDTVEHNNFKCTVIMIDKNLIGTNLKRNGCTVKENHCEYFQYKFLKKMGFKDKDPLFWIDKEELKLIKGLVDY